MVYAVILFAVASALQSYLSGLKTYDVDVNRVSKVLHEKESRTDSIIANVRSMVETGNGIVRENSIYVLQENLKELENQGISIFVFENDTLRFWSDNKSPINKLYSQSGIYNRIAHLSNGWYEIRTVTKDKTIYVGLILLKNEYSIENKYLSKSFVPEFHISPTFKLSPITLSYGFDIQDKEGKYIFTLVPLNEVDNDAADYTSVGILFLAGLLFLLLFLLQYIGTLAIR